jgi:hypothetical protein
MENDLNNPQRRGLGRRLSRVLIVGLPAAVILLLLLWWGTRTMLRDAAAKGDLTKVRMLLYFAAGPRTINSTNMYGYGPMQLAAQHGHADVLALLIERGGNVNLRRPSSWNTPLIMAASRGRADCCRLLLDKGADPNEYGMFGGTRHTALQCAAEGGHLDVVNLFLDRGIGPNEKEGSTSALHRACKNNHLDVVKRLVAAGADINSRQEWDKYTPLQLAVKYERSEIAAFLRQAGAAER